MSAWKPTELLNRWCNKRYDCGQSCWMDGKKVSRRNER